MIRSTVYFDRIPNAVVNNESINNQEEPDEFERALDAFINSELELLKDNDEYEFESDFDNVPDTSADTPKENAEESFITPAFSRLVGLKAVKEKLNTYEKVVRFNKLRSDIGLPYPSMPLHAMFLGSPGTGKTTVAKMMGVMLRRAGLLSRGHVVIKERSTLMGPCYGNEEANTLAAIEEAQGGILFIDEAYQLCQHNDPKDPAKFVIETLMMALADESKRDWMLILAGYPEPMKRMFGMNPGLKSRIPDSNIYVFDDFTGQELMEIAEGYIERNQFSLSSEARNALSQRLAADYANKGDNFGNARYVVNLIETEILPAMAMRVVSAGLSDAGSLSEIQASDIPVAVKSIQLPRLRIGYCA